MPCNTEYMEPTVKERQVKEARDLISYVMEQSDNPMVFKGDKTVVLSNKVIEFDNVVPSLCMLIRAMSKQQQDKIIYDGRNRMARKLADWWEEHQDEDIKREAAERKKLMAANYPNHVWVVKRNNDMTEGRGPMVLDCIYADPDKAIEYICAQQGVMGVKSALRHTPQIERDGKLLTFDTWTANDHSVTPVMLK